MNRIITADEARRLLAALDAKCPMCGATPLHPIHASTCGVFQVADLAATVIALSEREAATDAWLAEIGHLSLAAAGVELLHLRGVEKERDRLRLVLACERGEWAPEGWIRDSKFDHNWSNPRTDMRVDEIEPGKWQAYRWSGQHEIPVGDVAPTALEAPRAATAWRPSRRCGIDSTGPGASTGATGAG